MFDANLVKTIFAYAKAVITDDHFVYSPKPDGWYHGYDYVDKNAIYKFTRSTRILGKMIADHFFHLKPEIVVGPTVGGARLADAVANYLCQHSNSEVLSVCADEENIIVPATITSAYIIDNKPKISFSAYGNVNLVVIDGLTEGGLYLDYSHKAGTRRVIKRGYDKHISGKKCLVVEDVINSGKTVMDTIKAVQEAGGQVPWVGVLCNRSGGKVTAETLGVQELFSLLDLDMKMYKEEECPICKERGVKSVRTDLGKGNEFLRRIGKIV